MCSFGHITPTKLHTTILDAWRHSRLQDDPDCWLIFVGENSAGRFGKKIEKQIRALGNPRIKITGWADSRDFEHYLSCADIAVQLRSRSRGETSGAVIDCLNHGLATIVNAHGTMQDIESSAVFLLPDQFELQMLSSALEELRYDPAARARLEESGEKLIRKRHDPELCGIAYIEAIEHAYSKTEAYWKRLDNALLENKALNSQNDPPLSAFKCLAEREMQNGTRKLLIDVSAIVRNDLKTGIERVVRAQLLALIS